MTEDEESKSKEAPTEVEKPDDDNSRQFKQMVIKALSRIENNSLKGIHPRENYKGKQALRLDLYREHVIK